LLVEASPVNGWCDINGKRYRTLLFDALAPKILAEIKEDRDRAFDARAFIEELHRAVLRVKALESAAESSLLPIMLVFRELLFVKQPPQFFRNPNKKNLHEYNVALFARDMGRVLSEGPITTLAGSRLDLGPSSSPNDGIPLHQDGAVRIVGRIGFREGAEK
jgi:hypothetical protein